MHGDPTHEAALTAPPAPGRSGDGTLPTSMDPEGRRVSGEAAAPNLGQLRGSREGVRVTSPGYRHVAGEAPGRGAGHAA
jgi:hypothetical protein